MSTVASAELDSILNSRLSAFPSVTPPDILTLKQLPLALLVRRNHSTSPELSLTASTRRHAQSQPQKVRPARSLTRTPSAILTLSATASIILDQASLAIHQLPSASQSQFTAYITSECLRPRCCLGCCG